MNPASRPDLRPRLAAESSDGRSRVARLAGLAVALLAAVLGACRTPATEVLVVLDSDAPPTRELIVTATVRAGAWQGADDVPPVQAWRAGGGGRGTIALPATFAVTPGEGAPRDQTVTLIIDANLAPGGPSEPAQSFRRVARFAFTPRQVTAVRIFLSTSCGAPTTGCQSVDPSACTLSVLCEEQMRTCGDRGECVDLGVDTTVVGADAAIDVPPQPGPDGTAFDAGFDAPPQPGPDAPAPPDAPPGDVPLECPTDRTACGASCVDLATDPANCGACGATCASARCAAGACVGPSLAAGQYHTCALEPDGTVQCSGQFWTGVGDRTTPATVPGLDGVTQVAVTRQVSCALRNDGTVRCWGLNDHGALGDGTTTTRTTPGAPVTGLTDAASVAVHGEVACAVRRDATAVCWGANGSGELGTGMITPYSATPVAVAGVTNVAEMAIGYDRACARLRDGAVWCWGNVTGSPAPMPHPIAGLAGAAQIALGDDHVCARMTDGAVRCFGNDDVGQLGDGGSASRGEPAPVPGVADAVDLVAGGGNACARLRDGAVMCWGTNAAGQLATGSVGTLRTATRIDALFGVPHLALGLGHSCGRLRDGSARCWGTNGSGQLGDGTTTAHLLPAPTRF